MQPLLGGEVGMSRCQWVAVGMGFPGCVVGCVHVQQDDHHEQGILAFENLLAECHCHALDGFPSSARVAS